MSIKNKIIRIVAFFFLVISEPLDTKCMYLGPNCPVDDDLPLPGVSVS